jgi:hypothetical protein
MRKKCLIVLSLLLIGAGQPQSKGFERPRQEPTAAASESDELLLVGTVKRIYQLNAPRSRRRWAVEVRVDRVVSGEFTGPTFTFAVHSPALSGLRVKGTYNIKAHKVGERFDVDESALEEVPARKKPSGKR